MRIAIVSDIHGNLSAFEAVIDDLRRTSPDLVVHGGDLALNGSSPAAVLDLIRERGWPGVVGNTDEVLFGPDRLAELAALAPERHGLRRMLIREMAPATREALGSERLQWLETLPRTWSNEAIAVMHATAENLWRAPLANAADAELVETYASAGRPVVVYAHIHHAFVRQLGTLTVANSGSVSLSYDGDPRASYLLIDDGIPAIQRVPYDIGRETRTLAACRYPNAAWLTSILQTGIYRPPAG